MSKKPKRRCANWRERNSYGEDSNHALGLDCARPCQSPVAIHAGGGGCRPAHVVPAQASRARPILALACGVLEIPGSVLVAGRHRTATVVVAPPEHGPSASVVLSDDRDCA